MLPLPAIGNAVPKMPPATAPTKPCPIRSPGSAIPAAVKPPLVVPIVAALL